MKIKKSVFFIAFLMFGMHLSFLSQNNKAQKPSDVSSGFTYDFSKAQNLIIERLVNPNATNAEAEIIVTENNFPKLDKQKNIDAEYKEKLKVWMENNPNLIISAFKNRKEIVQAF